MPETKRFPTGKRALLFWLALVGICPVFFFVVPHVMPSLAAPGDVFYRRDGVWHAAGKLPGGPAALRISPGGAVWVSTAFHATLSRYEGGRWISYQGADFGTATNWVRGGFAFSGEQVWGATDEGVIHFDGKKWRLDPDALKTGKPVATVANSDGAWVLDQDGNLSHFNGTRWSMESLRNELPGVRWGIQPSFDKPSMGLTADGSLWIVWQGLWRFDGRSWGEVRPAGSHLAAAELIGEDAEHVWLRQGDGIEAVTSAGDIAARYTNAEMATSKNTVIRRVAARGGQLWISTGMDLLTYTKAGWQRIAVPEAIPVISAIALGPDLTLWAAGDKPVARARLLASVGPMLALSMVMLLALVLLTWWWFSSMARDRLKAQEVTARATGQAPSPKTFHEKTGRLLHSLAIAAVVLLVINAPFEGLTKWTFRYVRNPIWSSVVPLAGLSVLITAMCMVQAFPFMRMRKALHGGDYDRALWWTRFLGPMGGSCRGMILALAGRPQEAEAACRKANDLGDLGYALMDQGCYEDAMRALESAVELGAGIGDSHAAMAEVYLLQGIEPEKALAWTDQAIAIKQSSALKRKLDRACDAGYWADKAWALALLGRRDEARQAIGTAMRVIYPKFRPALAGVHWRIGMAQIAMDEKGQALEHFRLARELDPAGKYGAKAAHAQSEHGIWGSRV